MNLEIKLGEDEGRRTGPRPGDGDSSLGGCHDADGTPGDALPGRPEDRADSLDDGGMASANRRR